MASNKSLEVKSTVQAEASVCGASVQLPAFDKIDPVSWFAVAEANFAIRKVMDSMTKYYYVLSKLDPSMLRKLSAFLRRPRGEDPFQEIRKTLCGTFEPALEQKLDALLVTTDRGDTPPKEFGMELQRLLVDATAEDILKRIFLRSVGANIVTAINASLGSKFKVVLEAADRAWKASAAYPDQTPAVVSAVSGTSNSASRQGAHGSGGRQHGNRTTGQTKSVQLCYFHLKFGNAARRRVPSCSRNGEFNRSRDSAQVFQVEEALDGEDTDVRAENC